MNFFKKNNLVSCIKKIYKITCPTNDTYKDMIKYDFLSNKLMVLNDPIINIKNIKTSKKSLNLDDKILDIVNNKIFLSIGRFTKQKIFFFI